MKILLTGGSGFLGSQLCNNLLDANHEIIILDNHSRGKMNRLEKFGSKVQIIEGDIRDLNTVRNVMKDCEMVWHLAYINGTKYFYEKPDLVLEVGIKGTMNTIEAALELGVRKYVLASTSETYNNPTHVPTTESERLLIPDVLNPRFSYGGGKIACELLALHYGAFRGLETVIFRPHNFIGPDMGFEHVVPELTKKIFYKSKKLKLSQIDLTIQGTGDETRAFCDVIDGATGCFIAGEFGKSGEIYHVGNDHEITIKTLISYISEILNIKINTVKSELREGGTPRRCPSINKLKKIGYSPTYSSFDAVKRCVSWYVDYLSNDENI